MSACPPPAPALRSMDVHPRTRLGPCGPRRPIPRERALTRDGFPADAASRTNALSRRERAARAEASAGEGTDNPQRHAGASVNRHAPPIRAPWVAAKPPTRSAQKIRLCRDTVSGTRAGRRRWLVGRVACQHGNTLIGGWCASDDISIQSFG